MLYITQILFNEHKKLSNILNQKEIFLKIIIHDIWEILTQDIPISEHRKLSEYQKK
jgi:5'-deoxynucleotidase YfbR-like HD superfamily hydrolase